MACIKPETFLTEEEIKAYLQVLADQPLGDIELSKQIKHPLFKVRSTLRELERLEYIAQEADQYGLTDKGNKVIKEGFEPQ